MKRCLVLTVEDLVGSVNIPRIRISSDPWTWDVEETSSLALNDQDNDCYDGKESTEKEYHKEELLEV